MRCFFLLAIAPALLAAAELRIDHVTVAGSNLKKMQADLASVGLASVYGGPHSNHATEMAMVSFPDGSYLELMAPLANADPQALDTQPWATFLKGSAGPCAWAVREKDVAAGSSDWQTLAWRSPRRCTAAASALMECAWNGRPRKPARNLWAHSSRS
jgi:hypothetical protein